MVENLVLSPQEGYHAGEVLFCKVATTLLSEMKVKYRLC
jgi:hypothetical protein